MVRVLQFEDPRSLNTLSGRKGQGPGEPWYPNSPPPPAPFASTQKIAVAE